MRLISQKTARGSLTLRLSQKKVLFNNVVKFLIFYHQSGISFSIVASEAGAFREWIHINANLVITGMKDMSFYQQEFNSNKYSL